MSDTADNDVCCAATDGEIRRAATDGEMCCGEPADDAARPEGTVGKPDKSLFDPVIEAMVSSGEAGEHWSKPKGEYYDDTVPDTLDLAERAAFAVRGLTNFLDYEGDNYGDYAPYGHSFLNTNPPFLTSFYSGGNGGRPNWGKIAEAIILMRNISGSVENLGVDTISFAHMLRYMRGGEDAVYRMNSQMDDCCNTPLARTMLGLITLNTLRPDPKLEALIDEMGRACVINAHYDGDFGYNLDLPFEPNNMYGSLGFTMNVFVNGSTLRALSRWAESRLGSHSGIWMDIAEKFKNFVMQPRLWQPEAQPKAVNGSDHAAFNGHLHSYTVAMLALLRYAQAAGDPYALRFARDGYEYMRNFGISAIGLFGESCALGDMILMAAQLSLNGAGDYWDDVERYVRNHLAEVQILDTERLQSCVDVMPLTAPDDERAVAPLASKSDVLNRLLGTFLSNGNYPTHITPKTMLNVICCCGNVPQGFYYTWESIVTRDSGESGLVSVNLLLNRASKWLDVYSYIPYEGKVAIRIKDAPMISVRLPFYIALSQIKAAVNGEDAALNITGRRLLLGGLKPGDVVELRFPLKEWKETYSLKWIEDDHWKEGSDPDPGNGQWKPLDNPDRFTFTYRGNTVVDIAPETDRRGSNPGNLLLYQRDAMRNALSAPMKKVRRFIPETTVKW